jgi:hypothetical protein
MSLRIGNLLPQAAQQRDAVGGASSFGYYTQVQQLIDILFKRFVDILYVLLMVCCARCYGLWSVHSTCVHETSATIAKQLPVAALLISKTIANRSRSFAGAPQR